MESCVQLESAAEVEGVPEGSVEYETEENNILSLPEIEPLPLDSPASSSSLQRLFEKRDDISLGR
jgi:hypothetical protein